MNRRIFGAATLLALASITPATAQVPWGTNAVKGETTSKQRKAALGEIAPAVTFSNSSALTGGVGLRNRLKGGIEVSGANPGTIRAAYLYWAVISNGAVPSAAKRPQIARRSSPTAGPVTLTATLVGTGASPCWGGTGISVYRAPVPTNVARGGGLYEVTFPSGASGTPNNGNPWLGSAFPMLEGASLVIVGSGSNTVALYDSGLSGQTLDEVGSLSYSLRLPVAYREFLRYDSIGADGQIGFGRQPTANTSKEETFVGATKVAGPGSNNNDSFWNGVSGAPLAQLWDNAQIELTGIVPVGTTVLSLTHTANADCITPVANVVVVR